MRVISSQDIIGSNEDWGECEEPRCRNPAVHKYHGRKLCRDHFEQYQEQDDRTIAEMRRSFE